MVMTRPPMAGMIAEPGAPGKHKKKPPEGG
jgi:hypothetical protein